jgi:hypothetical protein
MHKATGSKATLPCYTVDAQLQCHLLLPPQRLLPPAPTCGVKSSSHVSEARMPSARHSTPSPNGQLAWPEAAAVMQN